MSDVFVGNLTPPSMDGMKPMGTTDAGPAMPREPEHKARIVRLPPVQSFGHYQADKWMLLKVLEESAELVEAGKQYLKADDLAEKLTLRVEMLGEWADVLQTLVNTAAAFGISDDSIACAMEDCLERNRRRGRV